MKKFLKSFIYHTIAYTLILAAIIAFMASKQKTENTETDKTSEYIQQLTTKLENPFSITESQDFEIHYFTASKEFIWAKNKQKTQLPIINNPLEENQSIHFDTPEKITVSITSQNLQGLQYILQNNPHIQYSFGIIPTNEPIQTAFVAIHNPNQTKYFLLRTGKILPVPPEDLQMFLPVPLPYHTQTYGIVQN